MRIELHLNGRIVAQDVMPRQSLADFLRDMRGLTGTHLGCEHGACGACTVIMDGKATRSCIILAAMADGADVRTIEGMAEDTVMAILRTQFHECHALQCGFCTPGMLMAAWDILHRHRAPDDITIRNELAGHICRCTGYVGIVEAIRVAGLHLSQQETLAEGMSHNAS